MPSRGAFGETPGRRWHMAPLAQLLTALADYRMVGDPSRAVRGVAYDSRQARPGDLFVAVPGLRVDGAQFAREAVARGATAVVAECPDLNLPTGAPLVVVPVARRALGLLAAAHWGYPSRRLGVVGVTGTDGNITTATL